MLHIQAIPIFSNNYVWIIINSRTKEAFVVDPGDDSAVITYLQQHNLTLKGLLITHSHNDHIGGISEVLNQQNKVPITNQQTIEVYGPKCDKIPQVTHPLFGGDQLELWPGIYTDIIHTPGHLPEHLTFVVKEPLDIKEPPTPKEAHSTQKTNESQPRPPHNASVQHHIFSGDILFSCGCGRNFAGTILELKQSIDRLSQYPHNTLIYGAHEYTEQNIQFALSVEPQNQNLRKKQKDTHRLRNNNQPTLPTTVLSEKQTNPFLRCDQLAIQASLEQLTNTKIKNELMTFTELRRLKDDF